MRKLFLVSLALLMFFLPAVSLGDEFILYENNFDDDNLEGWMHVSNVHGIILADWTTQNGVLRCNNISGRSQCLLLHSLALPESYTIELDIRAITYSGGSLYTRWMGWGNAISHGYYRSGNLYISDTVNNEVLDRVDKTNPVDTSEWHHLKFVENSTQCSLYFDGNLMYENFVIQPRSGGFLMLSAASGIREFDNLVIKTSMCDADYNNDGVVNGKDVAKKRQDTNNEFGDWFDNCWLPSKFGE